LSLGAVACRVNGNERTLATSGCALLAALLLVAGAFQLFVAGRDVLADPAEGPDPPSLREPDDQAASHGEPLAPTSSTGGAKAPSRVAVGAGIGMLVSGFALVLVAMVIPGFNDRPSGTREAIRQVQDWTRDRR